MNSRFVLTLIFLSLVLGYAVGFRSGYKCAGKQTAPTAHYDPYFTKVNAVVGDLK